MTKSLRACVFLWLALYIYFVNQVAACIAAVNTSFLEKMFSLVIYHGTFTLRDAEMMNDASHKQQQQQPQQHASLIFSLVHSYTSPGHR